MEEYQVTELNVTMSGVPHVDADLPEGCTVPKGNDDSVQFEDSVTAIKMLCDSFKKPPPSSLTPKEIAEEAQKLIDSLNIKRKHDTKVLEEFKQQMEAFAQSAIERLQQNLFKTYEKQRLIIEDKLQNLFSCLDRVAATETEITNFRQSLHRLYEEMQHIEK